MINTAAISASVKPYLCTRAALNELIAKRRPCTKCAKCQADLHTLWPTPSANHRFLPSMSRRHFMAQLNPRLSSINQRFHSDCAGERFINRCRAESCSREHVGQRGGRGGEEEVVRHPLLWEEPQTHTGVSLWRSLRCTTVKSAANHVTTPQHR